MEMVLFIGIQATGKSSFYLERFFRAHVRVNLDMLKTHHREDLLMKACLEGETPFVVDNTPPSGRGCLYQYFSRGGTYNRLCSDYSGRT